MQGHSQSFLLTAVSTHHQNGGTEWWLMIEHCGCFFVLLNHKLSVTEFFLFVWRTQVLLKTLLPFESTEKRRDAFHSKTPAGQSLTSSNRGSQDNLFQFKTAAVLIKLDNHHIAPARFQHFRSMFSVTSLPQFIYLSLLSNTSRIFGHTMRPMMSLLHVILWDSLHSSLFLS